MTRYPENPLLRTARQTSVRIDDPPESRQGTLATGAVLVNSHTAASTASFRTPVIRTLIEIGPSPRASSATRHGVTVAFVKPPGRGAYANQAMNSSKPKL
jgi:hypothetical protein